MKFNLIKFSLAALTMLFSNIYCSVPDRTESEETISSTDSTELDVEIENLLNIQIKILEAMNNREFEANKNSLENELKNALEKAEKVKHAQKDKICKDTLILLGRIIDFYNQFFKYDQCQKCEKFFETIPKCTKCKCIKYCSTECQTADWEDHKLECKNLLKLRLQAEDEKKRTELAEVKVEILNTLNKDLEQRLDKLPKLEKTETDQHSKEIEIKKKIEVVDNIMKQKIADLENAYGQFFHEEDLDKLKQNFANALHSALTQLSNLEKALANALQPEIVEMLKSYRKKIETLSTPPVVTSPSSLESKRSPEISSPAVSPSSIESKESPAIVSPASSTETESISSPDSPSTLQSPTKSSDSEPILTDSDDDSDKDEEDDEIEESPEFSDLTPYLVAKIFNDHMNKLQRLMEDK